MSQTYYIKLFVGPQMQVLKISCALSEVKIIPVIKDRAESARLAGFGSFSRDQEIWFILTKKKRRKKF